MKNKIFSLLLCFVLAFAMYSCTEVTPTHDTGNAGAYSVTKIESKALSRAVDLGTFTVDSTINVQFILTNSGDYAIKETSFTLSADGITIDSNDFTVTPGSITQIDPVGESGVNYIVTVALNHGLVYGKIGTYNLLTGLTKLTLNIAGKTSIDGTNYTTDVSTDVVINTDVHYADWKIQYKFGDVWADAQKSYSVDGSFLWSSVYDGIRLQPIAIRIVNTGNVSIGYYVPSNDGMSDAAFTDVNTYIPVPSGASVDISPFAGYVYVNTFGTMYDYSTAHDNPSGQPLFDVGSVVKEYLER